MKVPKENNEIRRIGNDMCKESGSNKQWQHRNRETKEMNSPIEAKPINFNTQ
jgi:hypothetical protein